MTKNRNPFLVGGMGEAGLIVTGGMNMVAAIICIRDTLSRLLLQNRKVS